ncbi:MAG: MFS transporter [Candidatus Bathyarchaeota archaeon]|nr:MAG: MFS transporter [Candidatus Bathyarchaeota archaeon]
MNSYGRDIVILSALFLVNSLAIDMIGPIWPIFISSLDASMTEIGLVFAISNAVGALMQIPSGLLSDRFGRRRLHLLGSLLAVVSPLMYAFARHWMDLVPWIALSGLATGLYLPVRWTIIADVSSKKTMASAYGWTNIAWLTGSTVAPFLGGVVADFVGIRFPFITCFMLRIAILPLVLILRETQKKPNAGSPSELRDQDGGGYLSTFVWISLVNVIQGAGMGVTGPIIPVFTAAKFQVDYALIGILYSIGFGVASIIVQTPGAKLSDRFDRRKVMFATFVVSAPFFLLFAYARSCLELILVMFLSNVILNLHWPSYQTYMMDATPSSKWGLVNGLSATTFWTGVTIGNAMSGILWDTYGAIMPFIVSSFAIGFSALPLIALKETKTGRRSRRGKSTSYGPQ